MLNYMLIFYTILLCVVILISIYIFLYYSFRNDLQKRNEELAKNLYEEGPLQDLLNGSGINNIPSLNLITTNPTIARANNCANRPVYVDSNTTNNLTDAECISICLNSTAKAINVSSDNETYIYQSAALNVGSYCMVGPRPRCNMKTSYALLTINSVICQPKFPNIVGGQLGNTIVACNNVQINDPRNVLWDYLNNEKFNPTTTIFTNENDLLPSGAFRFRCKFDGLDKRANKYIENPLNRFHPIENYCADLIYRAHPDVQTKFEYDDNKSISTFTCDCGNESDTRVKNLDPNNPRSQCSSISQEIVDDVKSRKTLTVPYRCFTIYSVISDVGKYLPCPNDQFTREGNQIASVNLKIAEIINPLIEYPRYEQLTGDVTLTPGTIVG
jgi:hypothetical protein